jgi:hypothetical protein
MLFEGVFPLLPMDTEGALRNVEKLGSYIPGPRWFVSYSRGLSSILDFGVIQGIEGFEVIFVCDNGF